MCRENSHAERRDQVAGVTRMPQLHGTQSIATKTPSIPPLRLRPKPNAIPDLAEGNIVPVFPLYTKCANVPWILVIVGVYPLHEWLTMAPCMPHRLPLPKSQIGRWEIV